MKQVFTLCIVSAFLGAILALAIYNSVNHQASVTAEQTAEAQVRTETQDNRFRAPSLGVKDAFTTTSAPPRKFTSEELVNINVYDQVNRGVVNIDTRTLRRSEIFFSRVVPEEGSGSGWVLDQQGHIVTNHHVIADSDAIEVMLADGESYRAQIVGSDPANDIAVIKIEAPSDSLFPVTIGESSTLKVGQKAFAIGNPFGLERTMTVGIISSLNRSLRSKSRRMMKGIIQLDAALNQGNSGGPLLDNAGELIGMNTAIASSVGENTGVGFAVPANTIRRVVPQLIQFGKVIRPSLGIDLFVETRNDVGVGVGHVEEEGPADLAGLRGVIEVERVRYGNSIVTRERRNPNADIILAVNGNSTGNSDELNEAIEKYKPGDRVTLEVLRRGKKVEVPITLAEEE